ncbi:MAG: zinc ribbon domain-containing protein [Candidatus Heimdallarchaeota archaeon]|nr:zinc ribbon domain-containing protein [Candidatus Heimdallarchaeota archaeon]
MNAEAITLIAFFSTLLLLVQIRFFRRLRKLKSNYNGIPGVFFLSDALDGFLSFLNCCGEATEPEMDFKTDFEHDEEKTKKALVEYKARTRQSKKTEGLTEKRSLSMEEEKVKVIDLVSKRQKTSIMYISNRTLLPNEIIIEIISEDPDFIIEDEFVINKKMPVKRTIKTQEMKRIEDKIAAGFCPVSGTPLKPDWEFCANCGYVLK